MRTKKKVETFNFKGIVFDLETQTMRDKNSDIYPLMSIAVTWDKKKEFRVWKENEAEKLFNYLSKFPYIVGANLNFDYQVLENYVPNVRLKLGLKTIDILTHARLGNIFNTFNYIWNKLRERYEGEPETDEEWKSYFDDLKWEVSFWGLTLDKRFRLVPNKKYKGKYRFEKGISLDNLSFATLRKKKFGKSNTVPKLFQLGRYKELIKYCERDVLLTRDIFYYGIHKEFVKNIGFSNLPVLWREVAQYLSEHKIKDISSTVEADNFAWQLARIESSVYPLLPPDWFILDLESVVQKVISVYYPIGSYPSYKEKKELQELVDLGHIDID